MRRTICAWIVVLLLMQAALPSSAEPESEVSGLLAHLARLMDVREQIYEIRRDALGAACLFCEQNTYESLLTARIVCDEAARQLQQLDVPALNLSDEMLAELIGMNVEVNALEFEIVSMQSLLEQEMNSMVMYESLLYTAAYSLSQKDTLEAWLSISKEKDLLDRKYDCNFINMLLLPISQRPDVFDLWNGIASRWPIIGEALAEWEDNRETLWKKADEILAAYQTIADRSSDTLGEDAYISSAFSENLEKEDLKALKADANIISGMPPMAPFPIDWLLPATSALYASYEEETGTMAQALTLYDENVALSAFLDYAQQLIAFGAHLYHQSGENQEERRFILIVNGHALMLNWYPNQTAMVSYDPRFLSLETPAYILSVQ